MSLNKFPPLPNGEDVGYNLTLNVGCDTLKCNNLEVVGQEYVKFENFPPPTVQQIPVGAMAIYKNVDDGSVITKTNYARWEFEPTSDSVQFLNMSNANLKNATSLQSLVVDTEAPTVSITGAGSVVVARRQNQMATACHGTTNPATDSTQFNGIQLSDEQKATGKTYFYTIVADNCTVILKNAFGTGGTTYDFSLPGAVDYVLSPPAGGTLKATLMWRPSANVWVLAVAV